MHKMVSLGRKKHWPINFHLIICACTYEQRHLHLPQFVLTYCWITDSVWYMSKYQSWLCMNLLLVLNLNGPTTPSTFNYNIIELANCQQEIASHSAHIGYVNLYMINNELVIYSVVQVGSLHQWHSTVGGVSTKVSEDNSCSPECEYCLCSTTILAQMMQCWHQLNYPSISCSDFVCDLLLKKLRHRALCSKHQNIPNPDSWLYQNMSNSSTSESERD
jgi:hypothetical protein